MIFAVTGVACDDDATVGDHEPAEDDVHVAGMIDFSDVFPRDDVALSDSRVDDDFVATAALDPALDVDAVRARDGRGRAASRQRGDGRGDRRPSKPTNRFRSYTTKNTRILPDAALQRKAATRSANAVTRSSMSSRS